MLRLLFFSPLLLSVVLLEGPETTLTSGCGDSGQSPSTVASVQGTSIAGQTRTPLSGGAVTGRWRADLKDSWTGDAAAGDRLHVEIRFDDRDHRGGMAMSLLRSDFKGLPAVLDDAGQVTFELRRDAGTATFEGEFRDGWGTGRFTFRPNAEFAAAIAQRGGKKLRGRRDAEWIFALALHDVSRQFIQELENAGYKELDADELLAFRIHNVTPRFLADMKRAGYTGVDADKLVALRIHGVDAADAETFRKIGYQNLSGDDLVSARIHAVTPAFVQSLAALGYKDLDFDDLVSMRIHRVTPEFIEELKALGYDRVPADTLVAMRIHRVDADFIKDARADGYTDLTPQELIEFSIHGRRWMARKKR